MFGFCITHILNTGCAEIWKKKVRRQKVKLLSEIWSIYGDFSPQTTQPWRTPMMYKWFANYIHHLLRTWKISIKLTLHCTGLRGWRPGQKRGAKTALRVIGNTVLINMRRAFKKKRFARASLDRTLIWNIGFRESRIIRSRSPAALNCGYQWLARSKARVCAIALVGVAGWNPAGSMDVCLFGCCVLSRRGLCDRPIPRPEESYRLWCVWVWLWVLDNKEGLAHQWLLRHEREKRG